MLHHELLTARHTSILSRAARRRLAREAQRAAKAARTAAGSAPAADGRERYVRAT
ncbi:hypothetical protein ACFWZ2_11440 [Streptomyces sp. NPDC059002]|uniref:hypothetical protein n=1 Tax=Streptomyces sp. NPDC059002 TaxID=3346690 RepID=UPI0036BDB389